MEEINQIKKRLQTIYSELQGIIDESARIRSISPQHKLAVTQLWQQFLGDVFSYIRVKSKETGQNLLAGISLFKI